MLIQITNHCTLNCPHCLQCSSENGHHMSEEVFRKALEFGKWSGCWRYNISGGEPTEHPDFERFIDLLSAYVEDIQMPIPGFPSITIESNGEWARSVPKTNAVKRVLKHRRLEAFQVSSFKGLYKNYDFIQKYKRKIEALSSKVRVVTTGIISMQDLGRAALSINPSIEKAVMENKYNISCLNGCFVSKQTDDMTSLSYLFFQGNQTCKPFVDWKGDVHWSESICCPSYGNVLKEDFETIWQNLRKAVPCGKCRLYKKLIESTDPKIVFARNVMGI